MKTQNMDNNSFSSDSTYYSAYENSPRFNKKPQSSTSATKYLNRIRREVRLHLEGTKLLGNHEAIKYMKGISRKKWNPAKKSTVEKLQETLHKIHKCNEYFQRSLVRSGKYEKIISDPVEDCRITQEIQMLERNNKEVFKPVGAPCVDSSESYSFQSDMLSNKNFFTASSVPSVKIPIKQINDEISNDSEMNICEDSNNRAYTEKINSNSMDLFLTQEDKQMENSYVFHDGKAFIVPSVVSDILQINFEKSAKGHSKMNISNPSHQLPDSNIMKSSCSQDTEVYLESIPSSFNDTMFKIPFTKHDRKSNNEANVQGDMSLCGNLMNNIFQDYSQHNNKGFNNDTIINENNNFQLKEHDQLPVEDRFIPEVSNENSLENNTDTLVSNLFQSTQSIDLLDSNSQVKQEEQVRRSQNVLLTANQTDNSESLMGSYSVNKNCEDVNASTETSSNSEELDRIIGKIMNMKNSHFKEVDFFTNVIPESIYTQTQVKEVSFETVKDVSSSIIQMYNEKIQKINLDISIGSKTWEEVCDELDYTTKSTRNTLDMLSDLFEKISIDEKRAARENYIKKLHDANFHEFDDEDVKELDMKTLLLSNEVLLKQLSAHFERKLAEKENVPQNNASWYYAEDYSDTVDWRNLLKAENV